MKSPVKGWTDAKFRSWIVALLRRGSLRYPPRNECLREAKTEKKTNEKTGRLAQHYKCAGCNKDFPAKDVCIDHIQPVVEPLKGFTTWDNYIERMFCSKENLQCLCKNCHDIKTQKEKDDKKNYRHS